MALLLVAPNRDTDAVRHRLLELEPELDLRIWPQTGAPGEIDFAVIWQHPAGLFESLPNLKAISSYGAGVEAILGDPGLPEELPVGRLAGPRLAQDMALYLCGMVLARYRGLFAFQADRPQRRWDQWAPRELPRIGLLGMGRMARRTARAFRDLGLDVEGWNRSGRGPEEVRMHRGDDGLGNLAARADFLICMLPLTGATRSLLDAGLFRSMRDGSTLVNVGRGDHLVETDLLSALEAGRPAHACLDVFATEPLPENHPFWDHPAITLTPHCASYTLPDEAAERMLESYGRIRRGEPPLGAVDRKRGY